MMPATFGYAKRGRMSARNDELSSTLRYTERRRTLSLVMKNCTAISATWRWRWR